MQVEGDIQGMAYREDGGEGVLRASFSGKGWEVRAAGREAKMNEPLFKVLALCMLAGLIATALVAWAP